MKTVFLLLSLFPGLAAASAPSRPGPPQGKVPQASRAADARDSVLQRVQPAITAIGITRGACRGTCPAYSLFIEADGTFTYEGFAHVERIGRYTGAVPTDKLDSLIRRFITARFDRFESRYAGRITDNATVQTLMRTEESTKTVSNYANAGPPELKAIEDAFDRLLDEARWKQPAGKPLPILRRRTIHR